MAELAEPAEREGADLDPAPSLRNSGISREMNKRCLWTNRVDPGTRQVTLEPPNRFTRPETAWVCPEHEPQLRAFNAYANRYGGLFLALMGIIVFAGLMITALVNEELAAGLVLASLGAVILVFPFTTPQTVAFIGVRNSLVVARVIGAAMVGYGSLLLIS